MNKSFFIVSISSAVLGVTPFIVTNPFIQPQPMAVTTMAQEEIFRLASAQMALGADEFRNPVDVTTVFPAGTEKVYCAFSWENAEPNLQVAARWYYTSEDIHILDSSFTLTRRSEKGVTTLTMPKGKTLPPGKYRLDFEIKGKKVHTVDFSVQTPENPAAPASK